MLEWLKEPKYLPHKKYHRTTGPFCLEQDNPERWRRDIQNVRLTCRRFSSLGTRLLIDTISVEPQRDSLSRLEELARHPVLRKSVYGVEVRLNFYHSRPATMDLREFARVWAGRVLYDCDTLLEGRRLREGCIGDRNREAETVFIEAGELQDDWYEFADNNVIEPGHEAHIDALRGCREIYRKRYEDQKQILESGLYIETITQALAQMPSVKFLSFVDRVCWCCYPDDQSWYDLTDNPIALAEHYIAPIGERELEPCELGSELPTNLIVEILEALPKLGTGVEYLQIDLTGSARLSIPVPDAQVRQNLSILAKQLRRVYVSFNRYFVDENDLPNNVVPPNMPEEIYEFLSAILDTDSLQDLSIVLSGFGAPSPRLPSIGPVLCRQDRSKLRTLKLCGISIHGHELEHLVKSLKSVGGSEDEELRAKFEKLYLLSGSRAEVVQLLSEVKGGL
ncbi:hypothetical protein F5Y01DRAFT_274908 [Xylaria sp. FL0043]|nr:hypothetical protein F5Y01DRAFT_274908 [Xylaria sp. FL0043]